jgi:hypothetical protein
MPSQLAPRQAKQVRAPTAERQAPSAPTGSWAQSLQHTAGNRAVARLLGRPQISLARAIKIDEETFTHRSKKVLTLFNGVVLPELERRNYKTYGLKARLVEFVRDDRPPYGNNREFLDAFMMWLAEQKRPGRGEPVPVLKEFRPSGMGRPSWPAALKKLKGVKASDNLRHVVRNATLKRALAVEFDRLQPTDRKARFSHMASALGVAHTPSAGADQILKSIYRALYLNPENLYAGDAPMNQVIGFSADSVRTYGEELGQDEGATIELGVVYKNVMDRVIASARMVRADSGEIKRVVDHIALTVKEAISSLQDGGTKVRCEDAGEMVIDIGLGFGFDLIDGRVVGDIKDIGGRQARLLASERALEELIASKKGDLLPMLMMFMGRT